MLCFCGFTLLQAGSAAWLFASKLGLRPAEVEAFYRGAQGGAPRSLGGLLEVLVPHLVAVPLTLFILIHLAAWARPGAARSLRRLARLSFAAAFLGLSAGLLTRFVWAGFATLKLAAFLAFEALLGFWVLAVAADYFRRAGGNPGPARR